MRVKGGSGIAKSYIKSDKANLHERNNRKYCWLENAFKYIQLTLIARIHQIVCQKMIGMMKPRILRCLINKRSCSGALGS